MDDIQGKTFVPMAQQQANKEDRDYAELIVLIMFAAVIVVALIGSIAIYSGNVPLPTDL
jgi:hypothetical protein